MNKLSAHIVPSLLKPGVLVADVEALCEEAILQKFPAICVTPLFVSVAKKLTITSDLRVATVVGFPFGYNAVESKLAEILLAIVDGADEIDMVINLTALKNNDWQYLANEINSINPIVKRKGKILKVNIEAGSLTNDEIIKCCDIYGAAGVDFIQTSTGFSDHISIPAIRLIRTHLAEQVRIDASGDIKSYSFAKELLIAGADRVTSGWGLEIVREAAAQN